MTAAASSCGEGRPGTAAAPPSPTPGQGPRGRWWAAGEAAHLPGGPPGLSRVAEAPASAGTRWTGPRQAPPGHLTTLVSASPWGPRDSNTWFSPKPGANDPVSAQRPLLCYSGQKAGGPEGVLAQVRDPQEPEGPSLSKVHMGTVSLHPTATVRGKDSSGAPLSLPFHGGPWEAGRSGSPRPWGRCPRTHPLPGWVLGYLLVVLGSHVKAPQEDVGVPQVAVGPALGRLVPKLLGDGQALWTQTPQPGGHAAALPPRPAWPAPRRRGWGEPRDARAEPG